MQPPLTVLHCNGSRKSEVLLSLQVYELTEHRGRQTQGKTFPYLFSQCQPIYARSLLPVQGMNVILPGAREQVLNSQYQTAHRSKLCVIFYCPPPFVPSGTDNHPDIHCTGCVRLTCPAICDSSQPAFQWSTSRWKSHRQGPRDIYLQSTDRNTFLLDCYRGR